MLCWVGIDCWSCEANASDYLGHLRRQYSEAKTYSASAQFSFASLSISVCTGPLLCTSQRVCQPTTPDYAKECVLQLWGTWVLAASL